MVSPVAFHQFESAAPDVARGIRQRLTEAGLALLGTIRADGSPRVSPVEVSLPRDRLLFGCMPGSAKVADLERDPRCCLLTALADRFDDAGEGKVFGSAHLVDAEEAPGLLREMLGLRSKHPRDGVPPPEPEDFGDSPVFEVLITSAAWQSLDGESWVTRSWDPVGGSRERRRHGPTGEVVEVPAI